MSTVKLPVTNGPCTLVDDDIARKLEGKKLFRYGGCGLYVGFIYKGKARLLHRFIMNFPEGKVIDHIDGHTFDNRRSKLRVCNTSENGFNRRGKTSAKSGYRLVHKAKHRKSFRICARLSGKNVHLGSFFSHHIAGIFADQILVNIVGPFVKKNFPEKITNSSLYDFLNGTSGRIFRVVFSRRSDGRQREMTCRTGVHSRHNGGSIPFDPIAMGLFSVYDVQNKAYRFIPLENVICIRYAKTNYRVVA